MLASSGFDLDMHRWNVSSDVWAIRRITLVVGGGWLLRCGGLNMVVGPTQGILMMVGDLGMRVRERIQRYGKERIFSASSGGGKGVRKFMLNFIL